VIIYLLKHKSKNISIISSYLLSYHNQRENRIFDYINKNCDTMFPINEKKYSVSKETKKNMSIVVFKSFMTLNERYQLTTIINTVKLSKLKHSANKYILDGNDSDGLVGQFIAKYIDRTDLCIINQRIEGLFDHVNFLQNIEQVINIYNIYDNEPDVKEFFDVLCDKNHAITVIYEIIVSHGHKETALDDLIYHMFKTSKFASYYNFRITGIYDWYNFDKRNSYNVTLPEAYMIDLFNPPETFIDITSNCIDIIYSMNNLLDKNNTDQTIINVYLHITDVKQLGLLHILN